MLFPDITELINDIYSKNMIRHHMSEFVQTYMLSDTFQYRLGFKPIRVHLLFFALCNSPGVPRMVERLADGSLRPAVPQVVPAFFW